MSVTEPDIKQYWARSVLRGGKWFGQSSMIEYVCLIYTVVGWIVFLEKTCSSPNPWCLWIWPYLEVVFAKDVFKLRWGELEIPWLDVLQKRERAETRRTMGKKAVWRMRQRWISCQKVKVHKGFLAVTEDMKRQGIASSPMPSRG